jgi:YD repeat-containing protein
MTWRKAAVSKQKGAGGIIASRFHLPVMVSQTPQVVNYGFGRGMSDSQLPTIQFAPNGIVQIVYGNGQTESFEPVSGGYQALFKSKSKLTWDTTNHWFIKIDAAGVSTYFYDYVQSSNPQGRFYKKIGLDGVVTTAAYSSSQMTITFSSPSTANQTREEYAYISSGVNKGLVQTETDKQSADSGVTWPVTVQSKEYSYYDGVTDTSNGAQGDLKTLETKDAAGNSLGITYTRYYRFGDANGYSHGLKFLVNEQSYARLKTWATAHSITDPTTVTDAQLQPFADNYFEYDSKQRVTKEIAQHEGCSCSGSSGQGTFLFDYSTTNTSGTYTDDVNKWKQKTVETYPDGNQKIVYTNYASQVMLSAERIYVDPSNHASSFTDYPQFEKYDSQGRLLFWASPSTFQQSSSKYWDDTKDDLLNFSTGNSPYLKDGDGLIRVYTYGSSTSGTISETVAGDVAGYFKAQYVQHGETGTPTLISDQSYFKRTANSTDTYPIAAQTVYRNTNGTGGQTISYSYSWYSGSQLMSSKTVSSPIISTTQNGPGGSTADTYSEYYDSFGRVVWTKDAEGYLTYTEYDGATGSASEEVVDADPSLITSPPVTAPSRGSGLPTALHLVTAYELDSRGRATKTTNPRGNITYVVYNDANHEIRTYPGWDTATNAPTGPTLVTRDDWAISYREYLTMSAAPHLTSSRPDGTESVSNIQSLSRQLLDNSGRVIYSDRYFDLTTGSPSYSTSSTTLGTLNTNYYRTAMEYDERGRRNKSVDALGTITRTVYDGLGRVISSWIGTDDTPTTGYFSPSNTSGTDLVKVSENQYDGGSMGDSTLTQVTAFLDSSGTNTRVNQMYYDWRDRMVATKSGVQTTEATTVHRPITYQDLDNLGQATASYRYDGDGVTVSISSGVVSAPSSSYLRAKSETAYDDQGRVYQTTTWSVDQSSGTVSSTNKLVNNIWYDRRGDAIKTSAPGGLVSKSVYDGAGRVSVSYVTDGGGDSAWSDASTVTGDEVLEQTASTYNANGAAILTISKARNHDETGTGALGDQSTTPKARVTYATAFYDAADRLRASVAYGTNGGSSVSAPSDSVSATIPTRSDTVLVSSYVYTDAGYVDTVTDPKAIVNKTTYDLLGRTTKSIEAYTNGTPTAADNRTTEYTYDGLDHIHTLKATLPSSAYQITEYLYGVTTGGGSDFNSNSLLATVKYPDKSTGAASTSASDQNSFTHDALGEMKAKVDQNGTTHTYGRDILGRMTSDAVTLATGNPQNVEVLRRKVFFHRRCQREERYGYKR